MRTVSFFRGTADVFGELGGGGVGRFSDSLMGKMGETEINGNSSLAGSVVRRQSPFSSGRQMNAFFVGMHLLSRFGIYPWEENRALLFA